ncbi:MULTISPECIES: hypothetical protein [Halomonadaceae]|nr:MULTISPECIES: hypothetical protein [Halomonas]
MSASHDLEDCAYRDEVLIRAIAERVEAFYEEMERRMAQVMAA